MYKRIHSENLLPTSALPAIISPLPKGNHCYLVSEIFMYNIVQTNTNIYSFLYPFTCKKATCCFIVYEFSIMQILVYNIHFSAPFFIECCSLDLAICNQSSSQKFMGSEIFVFFKIVQYLVKLEIECPLYSPYLSVKGQS